MPSQFYGIENLAHLKESPDCGFSVYTLPSKIVGGSGSPTRVMALLNK